MSIENWRKAKARRLNAERYLSLIGKTTTGSTLSNREGEHRTAGKLANFSVKTQIRFQPYDGAKNHHDCEELDAALAEVLRKKWDDISKEAIELLRRKEGEAAIAAEADVNDLLAEIRHVKAATE